MKPIDSKSHTYSSYVFRPFFQNKIILLSILFFCFFAIRGQDIDTLSSTDHKVLSESLISGNYDDLKKNIDTYRNDKEIANLYGKVYVKKAKKEKDTIQIANGYDLLFKVNFSNYDIALEYVDSIIVVTQNTKHEYYPSRGYLNKGSLLVNTKKYREALAHYLTALKYAKDNNNIRHQIAISHNIGRLKWILNNQDEAILIFKENLLFLESNRLKKGYNQAVIATLIALSESYNKLEKVDSADIYIRRGIQESFKRNYYDFYENFLVASGINNTLRKNHTQALDTLYKVEDMLSYTDDVTTKSICQTYIAKNLVALDKKEDAVIYLKQIDSVITPSNYMPDVRDAFQLLINHYSDIGDNKSLFPLFGKVIKLDSLTSQMHKELSIDIVKKYDTELIIQKRNLLAKEMANQKDEYIKRNIIILICIASSVILLFFWFYRKQKLLTQKIIKEKEQIIFNTIPKIKVKKDIEIPKELLTELSSKLKVFESSKRFLNPSISLVSTAKELETNSTYLSRVINTTTDKNFANYINDLRIEYAIEKLNNDSKFPLYSITAIAQEVGFNNSKSFSRAFLKKTGEHPSSFIKHL